MPHGGETNWTCAAMHDPVGRRGVWYRATRDDTGRLVALDVCGGREGDDYFVSLTPGTVPAAVIQGLYDVLSTSHGVLADWCENFRTILRQED